MEPLVEFGGEVEEAVGEVERIYRWAIGAMAWAVSESLDIL